MQLGNVADVAKNAFKEFVSDVKGDSFPDLEHTFGMPPSEISKLKQYLESKNKP